MSAGRAVLVDIDGVLTVSWQALPGSAEALVRLREAGHRVVLLTNTTSRPRASIAETLMDQGYDVNAEDIVTAPVLTAAYLQEHYPGARCLLLNSGDIRSDLSGLMFVDEDQDADVVVVGGAGDEFSYSALNRVFQELDRGARLVAMHRSLYWRTDEGLQLDAGAFVVGLERAAGVEAEVIGKPAEAFFTTALAEVDASQSGSVMVGDDVESDVLAAQEAGLTGVLVRTGKYRREVETTASGRPDHVVDSFADVPDLLADLDG